MKLGVVTNAGSLEGEVAMRAAGACAVEPVLLSQPSDSFEGLAAMVVVSDLSDARALVLGAAERGLPILGLGAGFGALCSLGLLDGGLVENDPAGFIGCAQRVAVASKDSVWTCGFFEGEQLSLALRSRAARFVADPDVLERLEKDRQVILRHVDDPTGSANGIAGITNAKGTIVGLSLHPQYNVHDGFSGIDGRRFISSLKLFLNSRS